jgi:hypothetical protein
MRNWINLVESTQATMTSDPVFKQWFEGSKIVDVNGDPQLCFHGTDSDFDHFIPNIRGLIFFTPDHNPARQFAIVDDETAKYGIGQHRVIETYLKVVDPFNYKDEHHLEKLFEGLDFTKAIEERDDYESKFKTKSTKQTIINLIRQGSWSVLELRTVVATIRSLSFDGILLHEYEKATIAVFSNDQVWIVK